MVKRAEPAWRAAVGECQSADLILEFWPWSDPKPGQAGRNGGGWQRVFPCAEPLNGHRPSAPPGRSSGALGGRRGSHDAFGSGHRSLESRLWWRLSDAVTRGNLRQVARPGLSVRIPEPTCRGRARCRAVYSPEAGLGIPPILNGECDNSVRVAQGVSSLLHSGVGRNAIAVPPCGARAVADRPAGIRPTTVADPAGW